MNKSTNIVDIQKMQTRKNLQQEKVNCIYTFKAIEEKYNFAEPKMPHEKDRKYESFPYLLKISLGKDYDKLQITNF